MLCVHYVARATLRSLLMWVPLFESSYLKLVGVTVTNYRALGDCTSVAVNLTFLRQAVTGLRLINYVQLAVQQAPRVSLPPAL